MSKSQESFQEYIDVFNRKYNREKLQNKSFNILIIGKTGVGKSTLVNAIFSEDFSETGIGKPVTKAITKYEKSGYPIAVYDTPGWEMHDELNQQNKQDVENLLAPKDNENERIHMVWYCVHNGAKRFEDNEYQWIEEVLSKNVPIILVLTQTLSSEDNDFFNYLSSVNLPVKKIIPVLAKPFNITGEFTIHSHGLENLIKETSNFLDEPIKRSFVSMQVVDVGMKALTASNYIEEFIKESSKNNITIYSKVILSLPEMSEILSKVANVFGVTLNTKSIYNLFNLTIKTINENFLKIFKVPRQSKISETEIRSKVIRVLSQMYISYLIDLYDSQIKSED